VFDSELPVIERALLWAFGGLVIASFVILFLYFAPAHTTVSPSAPVQDQPYPAIENHGQG
jgi:hypothetical protein